MYIDRYETYLKEMPQIIDRCKMSGKVPFFGYTSNLDVVLKWDANRFNELAAPYQSVDPKRNSGYIIDSMEELIQKLGYHAIQGSGGECDITSKEICEILEDTFSVKFSLGGTCAQGIAALAEVGIPLIAHVTDRSPQVMKLLDSPNIRFVQGGQLTGSEGYSLDMDPIKHIIIQFNKGDVIHISGKTYNIPLSNRLIVDFDQVHKALTVTEDFLDYCEENAQWMTSYNVSGFNAIIDPLIMKKTLDELIAHYQRVKNVNPKVIVYLEGAHYLNPKIKATLFENSHKFVDLMGMNEEELVDIILRMGGHVDINCLSSVLEALEQIRTTYKIPGLVMHTKDYSLFYGRQFPNVDFERGLTLGNIMSGTRARTGNYASLEDCFESLAMPLSSVGVALAEDLSKMKIDQKCYLVPSRYIDVPICTIGLGDTFVAGMQIGLISL